MAGPERALAHWLTTSCLSLSRPNITHLLICSGITILSGRCTCIFMFMLPGCSVDESLCGGGWIQNLACTKQALAHWLAMSCLSLMPQHHRLVDLQWGYYSIWLLYSRIRIYACVGVAELKTQPVLSEHGCVGLPHHSSPTHPPCATSIVIIIPLPPSCLEIYLNHNQEWECRSLN